MGFVSQRLRIVVLLVVGSLFLATACEEERRRKSSDDDDATTSTGGNSTGPGSGGGMTVPGGPEVTSLIASPATLEESDSTSITAMVVDEDGLDDIVGGVLTDASGETVIATFIQVSGGTFTASTSWWALHEVEPLNFAEETTRTLIAQFTDTTQKVGTRSLVLTLHCESGTVNQGKCDPCASCGTVLAGNADAAICGWDSRTASCSPGSECADIEQLMHCACDGVNPPCLDDCNFFCDGYVPLEPYCDACVAQYCSAEYAACN